MLQPSFIRYALIRSSAEQSEEDASDRVPPAESYDADQARGMPSVTVRHIPSNSPARDAIERLVRLLIALEREFDADWFDQALFVQRVDPLLEEAEEAFSLVKSRDPDFNVAPLRQQLWHYMMQRLRGA